MTAFSLFVLSLVILGQFSVTAFGTASVAKHGSSVKMAFGLLGGSSKTPNIPTSPSQRDKQAISSVKAAMAAPKDPSFPLIECEYPPLQALNKLGDGSLRSSAEVERSNLSFAVKLLQSISPLPMMGPKTCLLTSSSASASFLSKAKSKLKGGASVYSLKDGQPPVGAGDVCVLVAPSSRIDYQTAQQLASTRTAKAVIILNGFAKDTKSVPEKTTMAYFLKPLTYNSQIAGYLIRSYPSKWTVIDAYSKETLGSFDDNILVRGTNTPDLRESGRLVQKSVDQRAIRARQS